MQQEDKNRRIEDTLNSLDGLNKAEPSAYLFDKITYRIQQPRIKAAVIPFSMVTAAAACVLLLVMLNIATINKQHKATSSAMQEVANYYHLTNNDPLYSL